MFTQWIIERKRDGEELTPSEIAALIHGYTCGKIPDYQMAAFAMAVFFRGMTSRETAALTDAMLHSGEVLDFGDSKRPTADKHSTGGIGDKISLILAPLAASVGLAVPMISARGLGATGGTLDKLESIPGFNVLLSIADFKRIVAKVGCCMIGQTDTLAPADRKFYALRDVTGTVPSIPLITASIMSKKLAEGASTLVMDVKCGRGAFMRTLEDARKLAENIMRTGKALNRKMAALITDMNRPLGATIGNAVEVIEAVEVLKGAGPADVRHLTIELTAHMAVLSGIFATLAEARQILAQHLDDGQALAVFEQMVAAQGGDAGFITDYSKLPTAAVQIDVSSPRAAFVADINAEELGRVVLALGAGRLLATDAIDHAPGISRLRAVGTYVKPGEALCRLHARTEDDFTQALPKVLKAIDLSTEQPPQSMLILETISEAQ